MKPITADTRVQTWVLYGPSGAGKTTLAATAPKPAILDTNDGLLSIADRPGFKHVKSAKMQRFRDLEGALNNFRGVGKQDWSKQFSTIIFDHYDDVQAIVMEELGLKRHQKNSSKDKDEAEQKDWGTMATRLKRILRGFKTVPIHKILILGQMEDRETGRMIPSLQGQMKSALPFFVDHTLYLRIDKKGRRWLHFDAGEDFYAKTRAWWLAPEERKLLVPFDDTKFFTTLFAKLARGPKSGTTSER